MTEEWDSDTYSTYTDTNSTHKDTHSTHTDTLSTHTEILTVHIHAKYIESAVMQIYISPFRQNQVWVNIIILRDRNINNAMIIYASLSVSS